MWVIRPNTWSIFKALAYKCGSHRKHHYACANDYQNKYPISDGTGRTGESLMRNCGCGYRVIQHEMWLRRRYLSVVFVGAQALSQCLTAFSPLHREPNFQPAFPSSICQEHPNKHQRMLNKFAAINKRLEIFFAPVNEDVITRRNAWTQFTFRAPRFCRVNRAFPSRRTRRTTPSVFRVYHNHN